jgi:hypothetical protein
VSKNPVKNPKPVKDEFDARSAMIGIGLDPGLVDDFMKVRKIKKAPATRTALNGIVDEAKKAVWSFEQAIRVCCSNNWQGFKAEWVKGQTPPNVTSINANKETREQMMARLREGYAKEQEAWTVPVGSLK